MRSNEHDCVGGGTDFVAIDAVLVRMYIFVGEVQHHAPKPQDAQSLQGFYNAKVTQRAANYGIILGKIYVFGCRSERHGY